MANTILMYVLGKLCKLSKTNLIHKATLKKGTGVYKYSKCMCYAYKLSVIKSAIEFAF